MKGYKVTWGWEPESFLCPTDGVVKYAIGKTTRPRRDCGPLAVFESIDAASSMFEGVTPYSIHIRVWECEYEPSQEERLYTPQGQCCSIPEGTRFASSITLTRMVDSTILSDV